MFFLAPLLLDLHFQQASIYFRVHLSPALPILLRQLHTLYFHSVMDRRLGQLFPAWLYVRPFPDKPISTDSVWILYSSQHPHTFSEFLSVEMLGLRSEYQKYSFGNPHVSYQTDPLI